MTALVARELQIRLPSYEDAGRLAGDVAGQYLFEADARRGGIRMEREYVDGVLRYRFGVDLVASNVQRLVRVDFVASRSNPVVHIDGPECLRHRWEDGSLCMWDPSAPPEARWLVRDGIVELVKHIRIHAHCEDECRGGSPWPKAEMAGEHPRKRHCPSCRGCGR